MSVITIQITSATRQKLARLKSSSGETYDDLINKLLSLVQEGEGRVLTHKNVKRRSGL